MFTFITIILHELKYLTMNIPVCVVIDINIADEILLFAGNQHSWYMKFQHQETARTT